MCPSPIAEAVKIRQPLLLKADLQGTPFQFETSFGVFSPKEIDEGTRLLLNYLEIEEDFDCLDLGCGYGPIGIYMAAKSPQGRTLLLDKDFVAVDHANANIKLNNLKNAKALLSNGMSALKDEKFDLIVSNIPAKVGNEMLYLFLYDAFYHLKPGGKFVVVTVNGLRHFCKRTFNEVFGNYKKEKQGKTYTVSSATK
ncbi:methyltransferase [Aliikangiella marina]|uniref:Methyltransferase n=1 Tax=Aliikangiella marina TaxID=1712262 RepID=A0A545T2X0_9GAMM|nr:methyltransferase [Aliikangiella marina]TQV71564.1 methyltransferase [Aliikangiella marina]